MRVEQHRRRGGLGIALSCIILTACSTRVTPQGPQPVAMAPLPRPTAVVVDDFAIDADAVRVDSGIGGTARRVLSGEDTADEQARVTADVRSATREALLEAIGAMKLPAQPATAPLPAPPYVEIRGVILSIDEGNRTRRNLIGFGAGKSSAEANAEIFYVTANGARLLQSYDASSNSGRMPGLAAGGAGAAAGHVAAAAANGGAKIATAGNSDAAANARRIAAGLADQFSTLFAQQGWIASK